MTRPRFARRPREDRSAPPEADAARDLVCRRIARQVRRYPDLDIAPLDTAGLGVRDAAFAAALYDARVTVDLDPTD